MATFTIIWRTEPNGDIYERDFEYFIYARSAIRAWEDCHGVTIDQCVSFSITKRNED